MYSPTWKPKEYQKWKPKLNQMLVMCIRKMWLSCKPDKPPCLVITMQVFGVKEGGSLWHGNIYMPFGRNDYWDRMTGEFVEFIHSVLSLKLKERPDWDAISDRIRNFRFYGRLKVNKEFLNLVSIQRYGVSLDWNEETYSEPINSWTTDQQLFPPDSQDETLISEEQFWASTIGPGRPGAWQRFGDEQGEKNRREAIASFKEEPTLDDFEDEAPPPPKKPAKKVFVISADDIV
jgi:hypothetical protein